MGESFESAGGPSDIKSTFRFAPATSPPLRAVTMIYDLEGFSDFFSTPDVQDYVPTFLNHVSSAISICIFGGLTYWHRKPDHVGALDLRVVHEKFLGDGSLYILLPPEGQSNFKETHINWLCNRLWNLRTRFHRVLESILEDVPITTIPRNIRIGIARGTLYELRSSDQTTTEYIGWCVNLASRLQRYCPQLGFIASARIKMSKADMEKHGYCRVIATKLKGFRGEYVLVDKQEFGELAAEVRDDLFSLVPHSGSSTSKELPA